MLQIVLRRVLLPIRNIEDTLIWPYCSTGDLSIRDAYQFFRSSVPVSWARHLWGPHIPPRISTFVQWLLHGLCLLRTFYSCMVTLWSIGILYARVAWSL